MEDTTTLISALGIGRRAERGAQWLLRDIDCRVERGDRLAVTGPSGSGKSLLLRALAQLDRLDEGEIRWRGRFVEDRAIPEFRSHVMYVPQRPTHLEGRVRDFLQRPFALKVHRDKQFDPQRIHTWLEMLGRGTALLDTFLQDLSGGESLLISLLSALQLDPEILLLDEPTSALDRATAAGVEQIISTWHAAGKQRAYVWVSHNTPQALRVASHTWRMQAGRLTQDVSHAND